MKTKIVIIDNSMIKGLAQNKDVVSKFPEFKRLAKSCGSCGQKAKVAEDWHRRMNALKKSLSLLSDRRIRELKAILNAEKLRFFLADGNRSVVVDR